MNKVLQAAGRVIRDSRDQGVILLLDQRFHTTAYQQLFPLHWQHAQTCFRPEQISKAMDHFWQNKRLSAPIVDRTCGLRSVQKSTIICEL